MSLRSFIKSTFTIALPLAALAAAPACASDDFSPEGTGGAGDDGGAGAGGSSAGGGAGSSGATGTAGTSGDPKPNGAACSSDESCTSGKCVDGVCCETACDGQCESCALPGSKGTCKPHEAGSDPDGECTGSGKAGDTCAGSCNGASTCEFPNQETSCGDSSCQDGKQTAEVCAGDGSCKSVETDCGDYGCGATSCNKTCTNSSECASSAWCDGMQCAPKKGNGTSCGSAVQCQSNFCEGQTCCATACAAPGTCDEGTCKCGGVVCAAGKKCITWHLDQDGDGFGATSAKNKISCEGQPPVDPGGKLYYPSTATPDCDDTNANVFPGQTKYFTTPYGSGNWDYDCNGQQDPQYPGSAGTTCSSCCTSFPCVGCPAVAYASCSPKSASAFISTFAPGCGQSGQGKHCQASTCSMQTVTLTQGCR